MKKYFLGSVGKAEAFRMGEDGKLHLAFVSKTLTDSGLNVSTTKDDIRGGTGAPIQFSFFHDPSAEITLTDIVYNHEYITAQLGATFSVAGDAHNVDYITVTKETGDNTEIVLDKPVQELPIACNGNKYFVWGTVAGLDNYAEMEIGDDHKTITGLLPNTKYCFRYLALSSKSTMAEITSMIIPEELFLVITAPIYAGDACSASKGKAAGHITFEVPRFQLNGAQEFSMNMSSNQTMSLAGIALASASDDCDAMGGKLFRIIEVLDETDYKASVAGLIVDEESQEVGDKPSVYGELRDGHLIEINNDDLEFSPDLNDGKFADKTRYSIVLKDTSIGTTVDIGEGYTISIIGTHCTLDPNDITKILYGQTVVVEVTPAEDYKLPKTQEEIEAAIQITPTGKVTYQFSEITKGETTVGKLELTCVDRPAGTVEVSVTCPAQA